MYAFLLQRIVEKDFFRPHPTNMQQTDQHYLEHLFGRINHKFLKFLLEDIISSALERN